MQFYRQARVQFAGWLQEAKTQRERQALSQCMERCDGAIEELREAEQEKEREC